MTDEIDLAFNEQESSIERAVANRKKEEKLKPIGECHYCGEPFINNPDRLFCGSGCEKAYAREQFLISQNRY
jgi:hypothetical protein